MKKRLPPLNALKAFEACARLGSYSLASQELFVTSAAVGQQIKLLEEHFSLTLFERTKKGLILTKAGNTLYPLVSEAFLKLSIATERVNALKQTNSLTISVLATLATKWLPSLLYKWQESHPEVSLKIISENNDSRFDLNTTDLRICYGRIEGEDLCFDELLVDSISPVCSPSLLQQNDPIRSPEDLFQHNLLHVIWGNDVINLPDWDDWFKALGITNYHNPKGNTFNMASMAIQAAIDGKGILLGQRMLISEDIAAGRLVNIFEQSIPLNEAYYIAYPPSSRQNPVAADFISWLLAQAHQRQ